jgi:hypothetical protein
LGVWPDEATWRDWLFWGALGTAVAILLSFALRLIRQLDEDPGDLGHDKS